jgi:hypothetical protein
MSSEKHPLDNLSVYADFYSLQDDQCIELIRQKIAENTPLTDEDYRIIAVERLRGVRRLRMGKYVTHLLDDPNGFFTHQAWANSIPGSTSIPTRPRTDAMTPESQQIIERITKASLTPMFKSAFHPDFDNK